MKILGDPAIAGIQELVSKRGRSNIGGIKSNSRHLVDISEYIDPLQGRRESTPRGAVIANFPRAGCRSGFVKLAPSPMKCTPSGRCLLVEWFTDRDRTERAKGCGNCKLSVGRVQGTVSQILPK